MGTTVERERKSIRKIKKDEERVRERKAEEEKDERRKRAKEKKRGVMKTLHISFFFPLLLVLLHSKERLKLHSHQIYI